MVGGFEWCHRDPKVSAAPRSKDSREGKKRKKKDGFVDGAAKKSIEVECFSRTRVSRDAGLMGGERKA